MKFTKISPTLWGVIALLLALPTIADSPQNTMVPQLEIAFMKASNTHTTAKRHYSRQSIAFEAAKERYVKASKNSDIVSINRLSELLNEYSNAEQSLHKAQTTLHESELELENKKNELSIAKQKHFQSQAEQLHAKARLYEQQLKTPVWVIGKGECILDEDKTMRQCQKSARSYAEQDAIEKGGKSFIDTVTEIKDFELIKDEIKKSASVVIIEQDNSGDYGQVKRSFQGGIIKFSVTIRVKLQGIAKYNPFTEKALLLGKQTNNSSIALQTSSPTQLAPLTKTAAVPIRHTPIPPPLQKAVEKQTEKKIHVPIPGF